MRKIHMYEWIWMWVLKLMRFYYDFSADLFSFRVVGTIRLHKHGYRTSMIKPGGTAILDSSQRARTDFLHLYFDRFRFYNRNRARRTFVIPFVCRKASKGIRFVTKNHKLRIKFSYWAAPSNCQLGNRECGVLFTSHHCSFTNWHTNTTSFDYIEFVHGRKGVSIPIASIEKRNSIIYVSKVQQNHLNRSDTSTRSHFGKQEYFSHFFWFKFEAWR